MTIAPPRRLAHTSCKVIGLLALVWSTHAVHAESWRFVITGDSRSVDETTYNGVNAPILGELATAIANENPAFVLFTGDLVYKGGDTSFAAWKSVMAPVYSAGIPIYPVRGNHDTEKGVPASVHTQWDAAFGAGIPDNGPAGETNLTYSFSYKNAFMVGLDQYMPGQQQRVNQSWLDQQFAANTLPFVFVFSHDPVFQVNKKTHPDTPDDYLANRDTFWNSVAGEGGRTYFAGHDHFYDHARIDDHDGNPNNDLHQFVVGTAGAPLSTATAVYDGVNSNWTPIAISHESQYGYVVVDITDGACAPPRPGSCASATLTWKHRVTPVPEPTTAATMALGIALLGWARRGARRRQRFPAQGTSHQGADQ